MAHKGGQGQRAPYKTYTPRVVRDVLGVVHAIDEHVRNLYMSGLAEKEIKQKVAQIEAELRAKLKTD